MNAKQFRENWLWLEGFVLVVEEKLAVSLSQKLGSVLFVGNFIVQGVVLRWG